MKFQQIPRWASLARDDFEPEQDPIAAAVTDLLNFLKTAMQPDQFKKAELMTNAVTTASRKLIADHNTALNEANSSTKASDDEGSEGNAYPPKVTGNLSMDSARSWAKPSNASGDAHKRLLKNMARIGTV